MKKILIRTRDIVNCWETQDACIVETSLGKKWVCQKKLIAEDNKEWQTLLYIRENQNKLFLTLNLIEKGKCE